MQINIVQNGVLVLIGLIIITYFLGCWHIIEEGHIGLYTVGGALMSGYSDPGMHFMIPIMMKKHSIQVTLQTDKVQDIPCGTSSGVMVTFDRIEVVNRLKKEQAWETVKNYTVDYDKTWIFDKIHHEINQFCSSHTLQQVLIDNFDQLDDSLKESLQQGCNRWAPGIEIIAVRVTKPRIPTQIQQTYEQSEAEKTRYFVEQSRQRVQQKEGETKKKINKIKAELQQNISLINQQKELIIQEGEKKIQELENQIIKVSQKAHADTNLYRQEKENEVNKKRMQHNFILEHLYNQLKEVPKAYYGENIDQYLKENLISDTIKN